MKRFMTLTALAAAICLLTGCMSVLLGAFGAAASTTVSPAAASASASAASSTTTTTAAAATTTTTTAAVTTTTTTTAAVTTTTTTTAAATTTTTSAAATAAAVTTAAKTGFSTTKADARTAAVEPTAQPAQSPDTKLHETLREAVGERFVPAIFYGDYDGDGTTEAFAAAVPKGKEEDWEFCVDLYYVGGDTVTCLEEQFCTKYDRGLANWDFGDRKFFTAEYIGGAFFPTFIWSVSDGECYESAISRETEEPRFDPETREVTTVVSAFDATTAGAGHTRKEYWFRLEEGAEDFTEYGAIEITREQLLLCDGAREELDEIEAEGGTVESILYRGNGLIHINYSYPENRFIYNECKTLILEGRRVSKRTVSVYEGFNIPWARAGHYLPAAFPGIAVYPEAFPVR